MLALGGTAAVWPLAARAQQGKRMRRVGVLMPLAEKAIVEFPMPAAVFWIGDGPSVPCGDIARCNKGCNPPYHIGLGQEWRVTLIRHDDDFELTTACQHRIQSSRGQHI